MTSLHTAFRIAALAGRRIDAPDATESRFPLQAVEPVRDRIRATLQTERVGGLVCAAACGADLLALDVAKELGIEIRVVLAYPPERFRELSVVDRPGHWGNIFDRIIASLLRPPGLNIIQETDGNAFEEANRRIIAMALQWRDGMKDQGGGSDTIAIAVWDGLRRGPDDMTADFVDTARAEHLPVLEISTLP